MKKTIIFIIVVGASMALRAQSPNLVKNPSFETYTVCPEEHNAEDKTHTLVPGWSYPNEAASDYFNRCSKGQAGVPVNFAGTSEPKDGNAYVGAILTGDAGSSTSTAQNIQRREYIQGELTAPMIAGEKYCITYNYRLASDSKFAVDQLSVYLSNTKITTTGIGALSVKPQINNTPGLFLDNVEGWKEMCYVYKAAGGEKFFNVGNFKDYENTNYVATGKNVQNTRGKQYAYYYFDMFTIRKLEDCRDCPCVQHKFNVVITDTFYTGGLDPVTGKLDRIINDGRISLAISGGTPPYNIKWNNNANSLKLINLPAGQYNYKVSDDNNCRAVGSITFTEPVVPKDDFMEGLKSIEEGASIVLENIFFEFNKTELLPKSYAELDNVLSFIIENDIRLIEISGHTDDKGSDQYNQKLSEGRAQTVVKYLVEKGAKPERLTAKGYGKTYPIETNATERGRAINRRVEFKIVQK
jgi:outer membrane protein OmpA-like peptidoglycan-associated protein